MNDEVVKTEKLTLLNSRGTRNSNNEGKGVVEFGPQIWSIDLVLVIV